MKLTTPPALGIRPANATMSTSVQRPGQALPSAGADSISIRFGALTQAAVNEGVNKASTEFAKSMLSAIADEATTSNKVFSPANTFLLATLLQTGATGATAEQLQTLTATRGLVQAGANKDQVVAGVGNFVKEFAKLMDETGITLNQNFAIWARGGKTWHPDFSTRLAKLGGQSGELINADTVNSWAAEKTNDKIKTIVSDDEVADAACVLASATYLLSNWRTQFDESWTQPQAFHGLNGDTTVQMMNQKADLPFSKAHDKFDAVRLPYGTPSDSGNELSMSVFVPKEGQDLKAVYNALFKEGEIDDQLQQLQNKRPREVMLSLPRHKLEGETDTQEVLQSLGVDRMFDDRAEFNDMMKGIYIGKMKQKAFIDVNEKGTEAAAVDVAIALESAIAMPEEIRADKPFLSVIHDNKGRILFVSTVTDLPEAQQS
jgi:serpin B